MPPLPVALAGLISSSSLHTAAPSSNATVTGDTLAAGKTLSPSATSSVSRNGEFALGFFQFRHTVAADGKSTGANATISITVNVCV
jgi:hypothetical protein